MTEHALYLKKDQDRRLRFGHCWVYSNEIDTERSPLKGLEPGTPVSILNQRGKWLGWAYANPNSLICARIVSRDRKHPLSQSLIVHRLKIALGLRESLYPAPYYRLVYGESDGLPGLVVDRYGDYLAVQITTAGMERLIDEVLGALVKVLKPKGVLLRNDSSIRELEGLDAYIAEAEGGIPDTVQVIEGGCCFETSLKEGQKTGWFYDQAANRDRLLRHVENKRVLDVFSYVGAWGIRAATAGAGSVTCVDASQSALANVVRNAELNGVADRVQALQGDAFHLLKQLRQAGEHYDVVVIDPPAFIKRRKDMKEGSLAYRRLHDASLALLAKDGLLVSASCSFHMSRDDLLKTAQQSARHMDRSLQVLEVGQQGPDHPIHPAIVETAYLKAFFMRVLPSF